MNNIEKKKILKILKSRKKDKENTMELILFLRGMGVVKLRISRR
ncbi:MAG: hypothetical protein ABIG37_01970 [Nanoarchaeota archaeon]